VPHLTTRALDPRACAANATDRKILLVDDESPSWRLNIATSTPMTRSGPAGPTGAADRGRRRCALGKRLRGEPVGDYPGGVRIYLVERVGRAQAAQALPEGVRHGKAIILVAHALLPARRRRHPRAEPCRKRGVAVKLLWLGAPTCRWLRAATMSLYRALIGGGVQKSTNDLRRSCTPRPRRSITSSFLVGSFSRSVEPVNWRRWWRSPDPEVVAARRGVDRIHLAESRAITLADCASTWWRRALVEWVGLIAARARSSRRC